MDHADDFSGDLDEIVSQVERFSERETDEFNVVQYYECIFHFRLSLSSV
jgi:hypothetical protein